MLIFAHKMQTIEETLKRIYADIATPKKMKRKRITSTTDQGFINEFNYTLS